MSFSQDIKKRVCVWGGGGVGVGFKLTNSGYATVLRSPRIDSQVFQANA